MAHNVLQRLGIHTGFSHIGAEGMPAHMGRDFGHLHLVNTVILVANVLKVLLPMQGHHGHPILIQIEETALAADDGLFLLLLSVGDDGRKAVSHFRCHGHHSGAAAGLGRLNDILHVAGALQLMIDNNVVVFKVNVVNCQPNELRNAKSRLEENEDPLIVFAEMRVIPDELQKGPFLLTADGFSGHTVVDHHRVQLELKGIFQQQIIFHCHLEGRSHHTADGVDGTVTPSILLQLNEPRFGIVGLDLVDSPLAKGFFLEDVDHKVVVGLCVVAHTPLLTEVSLHQFQHRQISAARDKIAVELLLNLLFLFSERKVVPLAFWHRIGWRQLPAVNRSPLSAGILILVFIFTIFTLALSVP